MSHTSSLTGSSLDSFKYVLPNIGTPRQNREETLQHIYMLSSVLTQSRTTNSVVTLMLENLVTVTHSVSGVYLHVLLLPVVQTKLKILW